MYIHLSDIHFGQEKGGRIIVHDDVKEQLIADARELLQKLGIKEAEGVIISGDIAYAGTKAEYEHAGQWLDRLTSAIGCHRTAVQVVPGNHDIDRGEITSATQTIIDDIAKNGDVALDKYLEADSDREMLYRRFHEYRIFAAAYDCPLDGEGTIGGNHLVKVAPDKYIKFHGINTALICSNNKTEEGSLLLGERQRVIPKLENIETVIIAHHPLHWLQDSNDAMLYIKNRSRIFISGHEHTPSHKIEIVNENLDLLLIASGAAVPPKADAVYTYCYNILTFDWDNNNDQLEVNIYPRVWDNEKKAFAEDLLHFKEYPCIFKLRCPKATFQSTTICENGIFNERKNEVGTKPEKDPTVVNLNLDKNEQTVLLRFFRELSGLQRLSVLVQMKALPASISDVTHTIETLAVKLLFNQGRSEELLANIDQILSLNIDNHHD